MTEPAHVLDIFLQPGDFYFGDRDTRIRTLLGSCISITLWHPRLHVGGMCHYLLPSRNGHPNMAKLDGRYGDEALEMFLREIRAVGTSPAEYEVKLFGGCNMFPSAIKQACGHKHCVDAFAASCSDVSCRNRHSARQLAERHGFTVNAENLGGAKPQSLLFELWSGYVWIKRPPKGVSPP